MANNKKPARREKAVGYVRVSTDEQAKEGVSLKDQEARIRAYCEARDWDLCCMYRDEGVSAKDLHRPGIQALLHDLKGNGVDVVVVMKLDRLTRSVRDLGSLIEDLFDGVKLVSVEESFDSGTSSGELVMNMLGTVAHWERRVIGERTAGALAYKKTKGEWAAGRIPYGWCVSEDGRLEEDPEKQAIIVKMKQARRRGRSYREIAATYGVPKSTVHTLVNTDLRILRRKYTGKDAA